MSGPLRMMLGSMLERPDVISLKSAPSSGDLDLHLTNVFLFPTQLHIPKDISIG